MSHYSDVDIGTAIVRGADKSGVDWIKIKPMAKDALQPASVDLRLGDRFKTFFKASEYDVINPLTVDMLDRKVEMTDVGIVSDGGGSYFDLYPGMFALGATVERITLGPGVVGRVEGKSSLGRLGLMVHVTAGFIDPGFDGHVTLEFFNASSNVIRLRPGLFICQMSFADLNTPARKPYGHPDLKSRYQGAEGVEASKA